MQTVEDISDAEVLASLAYLDKRIEEVRGVIKAGEESNPFYFFEPSRGDLSEKERQFLGRWLKPEDIPQRLDSQYDALMCDAEIRLDGGGNQCLGGESEIYDPIQNEKRQVDDISGDFHVLAWNGTRFTPTIAHRPFQKEIDDLYEFTLSNGEVFTASLSHSVLTRTGYLSLRRVVDEGLQVLSPTIGDTYPLILSEDGRRSLKTEQGFRYGCPSYLHLHDAQPLSVRDTVRFVSPSLIDALEHRELVSSHLDVQDCKLRYIHPYRCEYHHANQDVPNPHEAHDVGTLSQTSYKSWKLIYLLRQAISRLPNVSFHRLLSICGFLQWAKHIYNQSFSSNTSIPSLDVTNVIIKRKDVKWDFTVPIYHNYLLGGVVHHNSGKSTVGAIEDYIDITKQVPVPMRGYYLEGRIPKKVPFHVRTVGIDNKQLLNTVLPTYRQWAPRDFLKKGSWEESFSSEQKLLTLTKGGKVFGTVEFMTNQMDVESFQGPPKDKVNYDEEPRHDLYKENLLRFTTSEKLRIRFHMTPTKGITWVKTEIYDKVEDGGSKIRAFKLPTVGNPRANLEVVEEIIKELSSYEERKMRLLGEFISLSGLVYGGLFSRHLHVIPWFPVSGDNFIVYRGGDPHLVKPSVFVEVAVDREENAYVAGVYSKATDTEVVKSDLAERARTNGWRLGQTRVDSSCNSTIKVLGNRNVFLELSRGQNAVPALVTSDKFTGSINAGVDAIKRYLKVNETTGKPRLFFMDTPEVWTLVKAMESIERDMATNEDKQGVRDKVAEGRWDAHAALRYVFQGPLRWLPRQQFVPEVHEDAYV